MKKLSIRNRGEGAYEIGPAAANLGGRTVMVHAPDKQTALTRGKTAWYTRYRAKSAHSLLSPRYARTG